MNPRLDSRFAVVGICGLLLAAQSRVGTAAEPTTPYSAVFRKSFHAWDIDQDGKLTMDELDRSMKNHKIKGPSAAALATLKHIERNNLDDKKPTPPFTLEWVARYEKAKAAGKDVEDDLDDWFNEYHEKVKITKRELFAGGLPRFDAVKQGDLGDCYFMCVVGNFVHRDPEQLRRMIVANPNGSFSVHFAGANKPVQVPSPTDTEIALNSTARENGLWLTVLEEAYGKAETFKKPKATRKKERTDSISFGGGSRGTIALLTGHEVNDYDYNDPHLHQVLQAGHKERCLMSTAVRDGVKVPPGTRSGHVYTVIAYDAPNRHLSIFDPYGDDNTPEGTPGLEHGFLRKNGVFVVSLKDFTQVFDGLFVEDKNKPARFKGAAADD